MFKHILVGIDDSAASRRTVGAAVAIAQSLHAKLELVHAVDEAQLRQARGVSTDDMRNSFNEALVQEGQTALDHAAAHARELGVEPLTRLVVSGTQHAAEQLAEAVAASGADLVVVGAHGPRGVGRMLLGSVAEKLARTLTVSLLIVRDTVD
ncbi:MAG: universal stress protein [Betaproteobacteria bacterium]|jgi:nucleotide-binding universal stress UspA family protein|nr:universal stress protein [Betaproteobacteria bacterium]MBK6602926.1 universal stress protein [Betaproteobacteria bacterium]MBK7079981.1 universal stress protein [Betaproteobacteria bacterium]MBK7592984.1 universal stress protein [Betaproteobacteria bacterium]MBK7743347.1 universal stress protein [Betaproteobacteria bacterium]